MSTTNIESKAYENVSINTSFVVPESNNASTNADVYTPEQGVFVQPSTVAGRATDISNFVLQSANELGKLEFTSDLTVDSVTVSKATATIADYAAAAATVNASAGTVVVTDGELAIDTPSAEVVVTNSSVAADSVVLLTVLDETQNGGTYVYLTDVSDGSFSFVANSPIATGTGTSTLHFQVL